MSEQNNAQELGVLSDGAALVQLIRPTLIRFRFMLI